MRRTIGNHSGHRKEREKLSTKEIYVSIPNKEMPQSIKECQRCEGTAKSGNRCKNRTCRGKLCWQHLKKRDSLRVKPSGIQGAGMGLFTTKPFKKNEKIVDYTGERMSRAQIAEKRHALGRRRFVSHRAQ